MSLFKRAAVRGIAHELVRNSVCEFPSKEAADEAADAVADGPAMQHAPEVSGPEGHQPEDVAAIANKLIEIAHALMAEAQGGGAPGGAPGGDAGGPPGGGAPPDPAAMAAMKQASERDLEVCAAEAAAQVMEKAAAEAKQAGALIQGGDKGNKPEQATKTHEIAELDQKQRPQGKYQIARGDTELDTKDGLIGKGKAQPAKPKNSPAGSNSVNKDFKGASLEEQIAKIASKLVGLHDGKNSNKETKFTAVNELAKLDLQNRPEGYAVVGQGNANFSEPQAARVGTEQPHPAAPKNKAEGGTNSVMQASKAAELNEEEQAFVTLFGKCAEDVGPYLPEGLSTEEKVAQIKSMMVLDRDARQARILELHKTAAEAKPAEGEKKSALLDRVTEIANAATKK